MVQAIIKLLRLRLRLWWNSIKHSSWQRKFGLSMAGLGALAFAGFLIFISWGLLRFLNNPRVVEAVAGAGVEAGIGDLVNQLPVFLSAGVFIVGLFTSFGILLQSLYLSGDMEFLLGAPIPSRAVFLSKLVQSVFPNLVLLGVLSGPALVGLGLSQGYNLLYFVLVPVVLTLLVLLGAGVSSLLVMGVVRFVAPQRAAEVLGVVVGLTVLIWSQGGQFISDVDFSGSAARLAGITGALGGFVNIWNPLTWPGRGLSGIGQGNWVSGFGFMTLTLALTVGLFSITLMMAERLYFSGWARVQVGNQGRIKRRRARRGQERESAGLFVRFAGLLPPPARAIMRKDARLYRRDLRILSRLITPILLAVFFTVSWLRGVRSDISLPGQVQGLVRWGSLGIAEYMGWFFALQLGMSGFSIEGRQWWIVKTSPIQPRNLLLGKYLVAFIPSVGLGVVYLLIASLIYGTTSGLLLYQMLVLGLMIASLASLTLAFGIWFGRFDWTNTNELNSGAAGCLAVIGTGVFTGVAGAVFVGFPILADFLVLPRVIGFGVGFGVGLVVCLLVGILPLRLARRQLPWLGEDSGND